MKKLFVLLFCISNLNVFSQTSLGELAAEQAVRKHLGRWLDNMKTPRGFENLKAELNLPEKGQVKIIKQIDIKNPSIIFRYTPTPKKLKKHFSRIVSLSWNPSSKLAWSPNGKHLASGSWNKRTIVWNIETGEPAFILKGRDFIDTVAWSPNGKHLAIGSRDGTVKIWNAKTKNIEHLLQREQGQPSRIMAVAWSPSGKKLAIGSLDATIRIWNFEIKKEELMLQAYANPPRAHVNSITSLSWTPDGKKLVSGAKDGNVSIWDAITGRRIESGFYAIQNKIYSVAWSPDGKRVASGHSDSDVRIWNTETGNFSEYALREHSDEVTSVAWSPDSRKVFSASKDGTIRVWDIETNKSYELKGNRDGFTALALSSDGQTIAAAHDEDDSIMFWQETDLSDRDLKKALFILLVSRREIKNFVEYRHLFDLYNSLAYKTREHLKKVYGFPKV
ncbi:WD40 repeat domain-containing protein [Candidatus Babeliales bacterium]|nr:WD40 repeat domain-containing protein [Candidatus Babeliales bacterium]